MRSKPIIVSAHQPNFIPYLGFFDKMMKSDILVIRDEVLFVKKEFHNRNKIRINGNDPLNPQSKWISVPVIEEDDYIKHIKIKKDTRIKNMLWNKYILRDIKINYSKTPYFNNFYPQIEKIFLKNHDSLVSLNIEIIRYLAECFGIKTKIVFASDLKLKSEHYEKSGASQDLADISKAFNADIYLSGAGGVSYIDENPFDEINVKVEYQDYKHPEYSQAFQGFLPYMSALDVLFNIGKFPETIEYNTNKELNPLIEIKH